MLLAQLKHNLTYMGADVDTATTGHINLQAEAELLGANQTYYAVVQSTRALIKVKVDTISNTNLSGANNIFVIPSNNYKVFEWVNDEYLHYISLSGTTSILVTFLKPNDILGFKRFNGYE